jgi:hypothetical protein
MNVLFITVLNDTGVTFHYFQFMITFIAIHRGIYVQ